MENSKNFPAKVKRTRHQQNRFLTNAKETSLGRKQDKEKPYL